MPKQQETVDAQDILALCVERRKLSNQMKESHSIVNTAKPSRKPCRKLNDSMDKKYYEIESNLIQHNNR